jgi:hypothetical protein
MWTCQRESHDTELCWYTLRALACHRVSDDTDLCWYTQAFLFFIFLYLFYFFLWAGREPKWLSCTACGCHNILFFSSWVYVGITVVDYSDFWVAVLSACWFRSLALLPSFRFSFLGIVIVYCCRCFLSL